MANISNEAAIAALDVILGLLNAGTADAGAGPGIGYIELRTDPQPASVDDSPAGSTLLGTMFLSNPAFNPAYDINPGAIALANAITSDNFSDANGIATWFRAYNSDGIAIIDGTVSASGGGGEMIIDNPVIAFADVINITNWTITMPEG